MALQLHRQGSWCTCVTLCVPGPRTQVGCHSRYLPISGQMPSRVISPFWALRIFFPGIRYRSTPGGIRTPKHDILSIAARLWPTGALCPDTCSLHVTFSSTSPGRWCGDTSSRHAGVWCGVTLVAGSSIQRILGHEGDDLLPFGNPVGYFQIPSSQGGRTRTCTYRFWRPGLYR